MQNRARLTTVLALVLALGAVAAPASGSAPPAPVPASTPPPTLTPAATPAAEAAVVRAPGSFQALSPVRLLDTRGLRPIPARQSISFQVTGLGGVPTTGVSTVLLTVTVTSPKAAGYVTVYPDGATRPTVSNLNYWPNQTIANSVVVPVGADGRVRMYNGSGGTVNLLADVAGFFAAGRATAAGSYTSVTPRRILDTRHGVGAARRPIPANGYLTVAVAGRNGIPSSGVSAVVINVTATAPTRAGYLTVYSPGFPRPITSSVNYRAGQTVPNLVVAPLAGNGTIRVFNGSAGTVYVVADMAGYYTAGTPTIAGGFQLIRPVRLLDTRSGLGGPARPVGGNGAISLPITGVGGVPRTGVAAVVMNVTATAPTGPGYITVFPNGAARPGTSNLDFVAGQTSANLVMVRVGTLGRVLMVNSGGGSVHLLADVIGYYVDGSGPARCNAISPDPNGSNITQWDPIVLCILSALGQSAGNLSDVDTIIKWESSGDPNAINLYDSNAAAGHPSEGLIQVIRPTFDYYRTPLLPNNLFNPAANLYAGLHYALSRYGTIHNVPGLVSLRNGGRYKGYILHQ